jgi:hypothetical protein
MITEDYVSFEIAKLLKEKGFDWNCESKKFYPEPYYDQESPDGVYSPTLQMACKWLREVHGLFIEMHIQNDGSYIGYIYNTNGFGLIGWDKRRVSSSYEQACEAAIKYCLKNVI